MPKLKEHLKDEFDKIVRNDNARIELGTLFEPRPAQAIEAERK